MTRRFLGALRRRDLAGIRRALFLEPLLMRNAEGPPETDPADATDEEAGGEMPPAASAPPSDSLELPKSVGLPGNIPAPTSHET